MSRASGAAAIYTTTINNLNRKLTGIEARIATAEAEKRALLAEVTEQKKKLAAATPAQAPATGPKP